MQCVQCLGNTHNFYSNCLISGEALGAIGSLEVLPVLESFSGDQSVEVSLLLFCIHILPCCVILVTWGTCFTCMQHLHAGKPRCESKKSDGVAELQIWFQDVVFRSSKFGSRM